LKKTLILKLLYSFFLVIESGSRDSENK